MTDMTLDAEKPVIPEPSYIPLTVHSHFSLLESAVKVPALINRAAELGLPSVGITDSGVMYGIVEFYNSAKAAGLKPIVGAELFVIDGDIADRKSRTPWAHINLICLNYTGYQNLVRLISAGQIDGFYYKPRVNWELLEEFSEGLIALSGDMSGVIGRSFLRGDVDGAWDAARRLKSIYKERAYLEMQDHGKDSEQRLNLEIEKIAESLDMSCVITNNDRFLYRGEEEVHHILLCMQEGKTLEESNRGAFYGPEYFLKTRDDFSQNFQNIKPELVEKAFANTVMIANQCDVEIPQGKSILPAYPLPDGVTDEEELRRVVYEHAHWRYGETLGSDVTDRLDYELGIINQMGFPAYFLITWEFINWAREQDVPVGPGRGSAAGSLVAYVLGITNLDPLEHNLLFERFLNPERVSMPDIDIDFCIERREDVIQHVRELYGSDKVCQIATFGTLAARAALKAVGRVLDKPFADSDRLAKMIPDAPGTKLKEALEDKQPLKEEYDKDPSVKSWVDLALKLEGTACNLGVHAAGVIISKDALHETVPIQKSKEGSVVSQYPMGDLEKLGLLKMDFLGLRNLTIINNTVRMVKEHHGVELDMDKLPLDDKAVYAMLSSGDTDGVFQLESGGMKALERDLKPSTFEDINALVALFRPGPLNSGMAKAFVDRKHGREKITYEHPDLEPILKSTYGTVVYQEQIMQIAQTLAKYSLGRADLLRRAMGKKKAEVMAKERDGFVEGCVANNVSDKLANDLFDMMSEFAAYCFNRSHSAAYAFVAYQTAYLKAHYPVEYLSALLSSVRNDLDKIQHYMVCARRMGISILAPDVTASGRDFTPDGKSIRFGLASIKNVGVGVVEAIVEARESQPFEDMEDFLRRVDVKVLNRKTLEALIKCGAFSQFDISRQQLMYNVESLIQFAQRVDQQAETGQSSLFDLAAATDDGMGGLMLSGTDDEYDDATIQTDEKELLGFYVSSHPLDNVQEEFPLLVTHTILELNGLSDETPVVIGGLLNSAQQRMTRKGNPMLLGLLEDFTAPTELVVFGKTVEEVLPEFIAGEKILVKGKVSMRGDDRGSFSIIVDQVIPMANVRPIYIQLRRLLRYEDVAYLGKLLAQHRGDHPIILTFPDGVAMKTGSMFWVSGHMWPQLRQTLDAYFGDSLGLPDLTEGQTETKKESSSGASLEPSIEHSPNPSPVPV